MTTTVQTAHTPGPWAVTRHNRASAIEASLNIDSHSGRHVSEVGLPPLDTEDEANASLIAAAPELLEACREAEEAVRLAAIHQTPDAEFCPWYDKLSAAIARAEGH